MERWIASTPNFGGCHSIQLSYERVASNFTAVFAPSLMIGRVTGGERIGDGYCAFPAVASDWEFGGDKSIGVGRGSISVLFCDPLDAFWLSVEAAAKRRSKGPDFCGGKVSTASRNPSDALQSRSGCPRARSG